jgi:hypothetical protein
MATLEGKQINNTYDGLLKTDDNASIDSSLKPITSGLGCPSALSLSTNSATVSGTFNTTGATSIGSTLNVSDNASFSKTATMLSLDVLSNAAVAGSVTSASLVVQNTGLSIGSHTVSKSTNAWNPFATTPASGTLTFTAPTASTISIQSLTGKTNFAVDGTILAEDTIISCNDIVAFYSSDSRLKNNIETISDPNSIISNLSGVSFEWNDKAVRRGQSYGFIAQEVQKILPEAVSTNSNGMLGIDYIQVIPILVEQVKALTKRIEQLES